MMKRVRPILAWFALIVVAMLALPLLIGIWLPDVFLPIHHTLAIRTLSDGHVFRVYQYWNRGDFYNTELLVNYPDGHSKHYVLDPDGPKSWWASISVDESRKEVTVSGGKTISW